ncbi:MAG: glycosyltransferase [Gammaproteobacteria bacterium]|nr:glycosyltransferase [Gammaproteobacteria bacterium]
MPENPWLSIIIPALDEAASLPQTLEALQSWRSEGVEIILVDGGSTDGTVRLAQPLVDSHLITARGRAHQMNEGARTSRGNLLLFLHADTSLPPGARKVLQDIARSDREATWGRFDVRLSGPSLALRMVETLMNLRSRLTGIATGDQAMFVSRTLFLEVGGFPEQPLMEDIELSSRLRRHRRPLCLREKVVTSSRRWEQGGILATILLMWRLRLAYWWTGDAAAVAARYRQVRGR